MVVTNQWQTPPIIPLAYIIAPVAVVSTGSVVPLRCQDSGGLRVLGAQMSHGLRARLVAADEHDVDAFEPGLGFGDVPAYIQRCAAGLTPSLGFRMCG